MGAVSLESDLLSDLRIWIKRTLQQNKKIKCRIKITKKKILSNIYPKKNPKKYIYIGRENMMHMSDFKQKKKSISLFAHSYPRRLEPS